MTELLYLKDSYIKEWTAKIIKIVSDGVVLDKSAFYPGGGGQPSDSGVINGVKVVNVNKVGGDVVHSVESCDFKVGELVECSIDWGERYSLMRMHTTAHLLSNVIHKKTGAIITGNALSVNKSRIDFNLEGYYRESFNSYVDEVNELVRRELPVNVYYLSRSEVESLGLSKLSKGLPSNVSVLRIVDIGGVDVQPDGGTHVKNTREIGEVKLLKTKNKGKNNKRLYFTLE